MADKYDDAGILIRPIVKLESEMDIEQLQIRMGEMAAEIERLQGLIDAANAQPAFGHVIKEKGSVCEFVTTNNVPVGCHTVYARPIPAQQSPAVAVPDFETWWRNLPSYRDEDKPAAKMAWDYLAGQISGLQSPRITDPTELEMHRADYRAIKSAGFESPSELLAAYKHLLSNRVTEQDIRDAIKNFEDFSDESTTAHSDDHWEFYMSLEGRALLDKLNKAKQGRN